jgi:hypothetical protein
MSSLSMAAIDEFLSLDLVYFYFSVLNRYFADYYTRSKNYPYLLKALQNSEVMQNFFLKLLDGIAKPLIHPVPPKAL